MITPVTVRLGIMMFLQFFVWGAWYVSITGFLNAQKMGDVTGAVYTLGPIAAIVAPFFLGIIADRFFATERVLAVLHIIGGIVLCLAPGLARAFTLDPLPADASIFHAVVVHDREAYMQPMVWMLLLHMLCYMPTLALTTSLAFHNLENQEKEFPIVRVLGTIGWIVGNIAVSFLPGKDTSAGQFYLAGGAAVLLGLYSLTLPHTPPPLRGKTPSLGQILGTDSLRLFRSFPYTVFIIASFLICIPLAGYYSFARTFVDEAGALVNGSATFTMSFGQMSEVIFMILMPVFFARLGVKWMLAVGMGAWALRYGLFMMGADDRVFWMILIGVMLHGICYDFFFVTGMIYVDKKAPEEIRNQAQGFLVLVTQGLGLGLGAKLFAAHVLAHTHDGQKDWAEIWRFPALFALGVMIAFILLFWDRVETEATEEEVAEADQLVRETAP